ncbi:MAG: hypothetical protein WD751_10960 [Anaerolineales bacterium]
MVDIVLEILGSITEALFSGWYSEQSWWVKTLVWTLVIMAVLAVLYFFFPDLLGLPRGR